MSIELIHEPAAGPEPYILRCRFAGGVIDVGFRTEAEAEAAFPVIACAYWKAFRP